VTHEIPEWVKIACRRWGSQKRRIWSGGEWFLDANGKTQHHADGFSNSFLGKLLEEREGAGQGTAMQRWPEVLWGDGLDVQRNLTGMPIECFDTLHVYYIIPQEFDLSATTKADMIGLTLRQYWTALERGEWWLFARLQCDPQSDASSSASIRTSETPTTTANAPLHPPPNRRMTTGYPDNLPKLRLDALTRPTLTRKPPR